MPKMLSEEMLSEVRKYLEEKISIREIADTLGVSPTTVQKVKKELPVSQVAGEISGNSDSVSSNVNCDSESLNSVSCSYYTTFLTKKEEVFARKILAELPLFEDLEEGWAYHITKSDYRKKISGLWWCAIAYPESLPGTDAETIEEKFKRVKRRLINTGMQVAISPLHDKDTWDHDSPERVDKDTGEVYPSGTFYKVGDRKKAHWHLIVKSESRMSFQEINALLQRILNCPYVQRCRSLKNSFDYFVHANAPEKYQGYYSEDIVRLNNFCLEPNRYEKSALLDEIARVIRERGLERLTDVLDFFDGQVEYTALILSRASGFNILVRENWIQRNPHGSVKQVAIVNDDCVSKDLLFWKAHQRILAVEQLPDETEEQRVVKETEQLKLSGYLSVLDDLRLNDEFSDYLTRVKNSEEKGETANVQ